MRINDFAQSAETILLPKGEANEKCIDRFQGLVGIEVPDFKPGRLWADSGGRRFYKVKAIDIPGLLEKGFGDVGAACTDVCMEFKRQEALRYFTLGSELCRFSIITSKDRADEVEEILEDTGHWPEPALLVPTSFPNMLQRIAYQRRLPIAPFNLPLNGSIEIMPMLTGHGVAADIVETGKTIRRQGNIVEVMPIQDIYACVVTAARNMSSN